MTVSPSRRQVSAVLLAAGASQRMKSRKQLLEIEGEPMVRRAVKTVLAAEFVSLTVAVATGDWEVEVAIQDLPVTIASVRNPLLGQSESIRAGLEKTATTGCDGILFLPCDLPLLTAQHLNALIALYQESESQIVASKYDDIIGTPLIVDKSLWYEVRKLQGDVGIRKIASKYTD
ncbi:nucleotidyltransferase family protein, partial [bacterium]